MMEQLLKKEKPKMSKEKKRRIWKTNITGWIMISPPFIGFLCFTAIPMIFGFYISFFSLHSTYLEARVFVGWDNYKKLLFNENMLTYKALKNTMYYSITIFLNMALQIFLAQQITGHEVFGHKVWRIVLFLPQVCSMVAVTVMWTWILHPDQGALNQILPFGWRFEPTIRKEHFMPAILLMSLWRDGVNIILIQSALVNVNKSLQEAARLDGANEFQVFWKITFQAILPTLFYMLITSFIKATQEQALFSIMTSGGRGPSDAGVTLAYYILRLAGAEALRNGYGVSSALSWMFAIILIIVTRFLMWLNNKYVCYD